jgi:esterase/lipase superfamily enzyme
MQNSVKLFANFIHMVRYDQIETIPVLFSWPSAGSAAAYLSDAPRAERSEQKLAELVTAMALNSHPVPLIDLIAHSHGTKLTFGSVLMPSERGAVTLQNLVFVAPDLDGKLFEQRLPELRDRAKSITVYYSESDIALTVSSWLQSHRLGKNPRLTLPRIDDIDIVDASFLSADWLGHSYHIGCPEMHDDIRGLLEGQPAHRRQLLRRDEKSQVWRLLPIR